MSRFRIELWAGLLAFTGCALGLHRYRLKDQAYLSEVRTEAAISPGSGLSAFRNDGSQIDLQSFRGKLIVVPVVNGSGFDEQLRKWSQVQSIVKPRLAILVLLQPARRVRGGNEFNRYPFPVAAYCSYGVSAAAGIASKQKRIAVLDGSRMWAAVSSVEDSESAEMIAYELSKIP